tara:strand:- start:3689 stop:5182 length:1494 start_codon:yes stop_codon:yes gene_type:complete
MMTKLLTFMEWLGLEVWFRFYESLAMKRANFPTSTAGILFLIVAGLSVTESSLIALPPLGSWKEANQGVLSKAVSKDRIFIVNSGWVEGTLNRVDEASVQITEHETVQIIPRERVSLIELSDSFSMDDRLEVTDQKPITVRVEVSGTAQCGSLVFPQGTVVKVSSSKYTSGDDEDDKLSSTPGSISFEKGNGDTDEFTAEFYLTILSSDPESLICEVDNWRLNYTAGEVSYAFYDSRNWEHLLAKTDPLKGVWYQFEVPLQKLIPPSRDYRINVIGEQGMLDPRISLIEAETAGGLSSKSPDRIFSIDGRAVSGQLLQITDKEILFVMAGNKKLSLPRCRIYQIELNDWEADFREASSSSQSESLTVPLRMTLYGSAAVSWTTFVDGHQIESVIRPQHFIQGGDINDRLRLKSSTEFGYDCGILDRSPKQLEAVFQVRLSGEDKLKGTISNNSGGYLGGTQNVTVTNALDGKKIWKSPSSESQWLLMPFEIQRSRLK